MLGTEEQFSVFLRYQNLVNKGKFTGWVGLCCSNAPDNLDNQVGVKMDIIFFRS